MTTEEGGVVTNRVVTVTTPTKTLKNDPDRRMGWVVSSVQVDFPERDLPALDRTNLDGWIADLRKGEAAVRRLRQRLEALRDDAKRQCDQCGRPLIGRADARYCSDRCRVQAHRAR